MSKKSRRDFLKEMGIVGGVISANSPFTSFAESLLTGMQNKIISQSLGINPRKYVSIMQPQAPPRWMFDSFFTPYSSANFQYNPGTATRYLSQNGRYTQTGYETINAHGVQVPYMWKHPVPSSSGGNRPLTDLVQNMLSLQGINTNNAGHGLARALHYLPLGAKKSMGALSADDSSAPMGTVSFASSFWRHKSTKGKSASVVRSFGGNVLNLLFDPFISKLNTVNKNNKDQVFDELSAAKTSINQIAKDLVPQLENATVNNKTANELLLDSFSDLESYWDTRYPVYRDLVRSVIDDNTSYDGFTDMPVGDTSPNDRSSNQHYRVLAGTYSRSPDLRTLFNSSTTLGGIAEKFTAIEYLLTKNLSDSVTISFSSFRGFQGDTNLIAHQPDEHNMGVMVSTILNFYLYRCIGACILELKDKLVENSMFDETIIELSSEFNRNARADGSGSDHGSRGKSVSYYSGAFKNGPLILGALKNSTGVNQGMWGEGAVDPNFGKQLELMEMGATLAHLLRVPSPFTFAGSCCTLDRSGNLTPVASKTKIIV